VESLYFGIILFINSNIAVLVQYLIILVLFVLTTNLDNNNLASYTFKYFYTLVLR